MTTPQVFRTSGLDALLDSRQIASFFLGCVFISAAHVMVSSSRIFNLLLSMRPSVQEVDPERASEKTASLQTEPDHRRGADSRLLAFGVSLCLMSASIAYFISLLAYASSSGTACSFAVAWGGISACFARLTGLLGLFLRLRSSGIQAPETSILILGLTIGAGLTFASKAVAPGLLRLAGPLELSLCYPTHSISISLAHSLTFIFLDGYFSFRAWSKLAIAILPHDVPKTKHIWFLRGLTLLLFDLLTMVPSAIETNTLGNSIPFSIGALVILAAFTPTPLAPNDIAGNSTPSTRSNAASQRWSGRYSTVYPVSNHPRPLPAQSLPSALVLPHRPHPFSSLALEDSTLQSYEWLHEPLTARTSSTTDSTYVRSAVVHTAHIALRVQRDSSSQIQNFPATLVPLVQPSCEGDRVLSVARGHPSVQQRSLNIKHTKTNVLHFNESAMYLAQDAMTSTLFASKRRHGRSRSESEISSLHFSPSQASRSFETTSNPSSDQHSLAIVDPLNAPLSPHSRGGTVRFSDGASLLETKPGESNVLQVQRRMNRERSRKHRPTSVENLPAITNPARSRWSSSVSSHGTEVSRSMSRFNKSLPSSSEHTT